MLTGCSQVHPGFIHSLLWGSSASSAWTPGQQWSPPPSSVPSDHPSCNPAHQLQSASGPLHLLFSLPGMLFCLKYYLRREALSTTSLPVLLCLHNTSHSLAVYHLCVCIFLSEIKHHGGRYFTSLFIAICPVPHTKLGVYQEQIKFIC